MKYLHIACFSLLLFTACTKTLTEAIRYESLPPDLDKTTLVVEKFAYADPIVYDPFFVAGNDSLLQVASFNYKGADMEDNNASRKKEHPLIMETNANLDEYNVKLANVLKEYPYKYTLADPDSLKIEEQFTDTDQYRYILKRKPVLHCYINPEGETNLSYRYVYYFHDRKQLQSYPYIELYSPNPWKTVKAIVRKSKTVKG